MLNNENLIPQSFPHPYPDPFFFFFNSECWQREHEIQLKINCDPIDCEGRVHTFPMILN